MLPPLRLFMGTSPAAVFDRDARLLPAFCSCRDWAPPDIRRAPSLIRCSFLCVWIPAPGASPFLSPLWITSLTFGSFANFLSLELKRPIFSSHTRFAAGLQTWLPSPSVSEFFSEEPILPRQGVSEEEPPLALSPPQVRFRDPYLVTPLLDAVTEKSIKELFSIARSTPGLRFLTLDIPHPFRMSSERPVPQAPTRSSMPLFIVITLCCFEIYLPNV